MSDWVVRTSVAAITCAVLGLSGCSSGSESAGESRQTAAVTGDSRARLAESRAAPESPGDSAVSSISYPPLSPPRGADQDFLRHMLDHYEAVLAIVHADMMKPEGHGAHGSGSDPLEHDAALDSEKQAMLKLLSTLYSEQYSPRPVAATAAPGLADETPLVTHFRAGIALVERSLSGLKRPEVRALAIQARNTQIARLRSIVPGAAISH